MPGIGGHQSRALFPITWQSKAVKPSVLLARILIRAAWPRTLGGATTHKLKCGIYVAIALKENSCYRRKIRGISRWGPTES